MHIVENRPYIVAKERLQVTERPEITERLQTWTSQILQILMGDSQE